MKLLFAIPHYCKPDADGRYGSQTADVGVRVRGLERCISALHHAFGVEQGSLEHGARHILPEPGVDAVELEIAVCTTGDAHGIDALAIPTSMYEHCAFGCAPMELEFECRAVLRDRLGGSDYYCFLEDDLILHDPWFFAKLEWFQELAGSDSVLQANRYELSGELPGRKLYIDGEIRKEVSEPYQDVGDRPEIRGSFLGREIVFRRRHNPHAASYFLRAEQLAHWVAQPHFLDRDTSFVRPLESAATLGIMRTFRLYKPAPRAFLEIQHLGDSFIQKSAGFETRAASSAGLRKSWIRRALNRRGSETR